MDVRSEKNLEGVHPDLQRVIRNAVMPQDLQLVVTEGLRTPERQAKLLAEGKSKTSNSRHLTGHAIDFALFHPNGKVTWDYQQYERAAQAVKASAKAEGIPIKWGGDWLNFKDGTHVQLTWDAYPIAKEQKKPSNSKTVAAATVGFPIAAFIPELFAQLKSLVGNLTVFDGDIAKWVQIGLVALIAVFVVWERISKQEREGT